MASPFFSIIVPVYNVEPYLRECLDSAAGQTFGDWECICVDDGSTDGSGAILDEYAAKDSRFRVVHQANAGVSAARNAALAAMRGEWFLFLDGDDALDPGALAAFAPLALQGGRDGILAHPYIPGWREAGERGKTTDVAVLVDNATTEDLLFGPYAADGFVVSRVYRSAVFCGVRFPAGIKMAEDACYWFDVLCVPAKWVIVEASYYNYRVRADSVCGESNPKHCEAVLDAVLCAFDRVSRDIGMGEAGCGRYIRRWPWAPMQYLGLFVQYRGRFGGKERKSVFAKVREIERRAGGWPFTRGLKCELWLAEHGMGALVSAVRIVRAARICMSRFRSRR